MKIHFGPAGNCQDFYDAGNKASIQMPAYLATIGLNAYEYQAGKGVKISAPTAAKLGEQAREHGIALSVHSPYYISISSPDEKKRDNSVNYILQSAAAARAMGATRIVMHSGSQNKMARETAMGLAKQTVVKIVAAMKSEGYGDITLCPETMGKLGQLGTLEEVIELCRIDDTLIPTIDFGHLNARTQGGIRGREDYARILDQIENALGYDRLKVFHAHFSKIQYTAAGEKMHLTFADQEYGPEFAPLAELIWERGLTPTIICESAGTQCRDALTMKRMYEQAAGQNIE